MNTNMQLPGRILVGLSGGADSMALCRWLADKRDAGEIWLGAVHVNHGLRGSRSDGDEDFVRDMCRRWQLPLWCYRAELSPGASEDASRQARYGFYRQALEESGAQAVALAHHRDDQAETFLLHLLRGAGSNGLSGMAPEATVLGVRVIRPLLDCTRLELRKQLEEKHIPWREDESNQDEGYLRNAVRLELLPLMERLAPGAAERIASASGLLAQDARALDHAAEAFLAQYGRRNCLPVEPLLALQPGILSRVLRAWWQQYAGNMKERNLSRDQTQALCGLVQAGASGRCNLPGGCYGIRGWSHLHLTGMPGEEEIIRMVVSPGASSPGDGKRTQALPEELLREVQLRTRQPGDWIRPFGSQGRQSLQDYLVNHKVDAPFRDRVPLLCRGSEVLLAAGVGAGDIPLWEKDQQQVTVRWDGDMPWLHQEGGTCYGT